MAATDFQDIYVHLFLASQRDRGLRKSSSSDRLSYEQLWCQSLRSCRGARLQKALHKLRRQILEVATAFRNMGPLLQYARN